MTTEKRFSFGKNWRAFLAHLDDDRVSEAKRSLTQALGTESLVGKRFLDAGSGSGLFSLAAHLSGAEVTSFDVDDDSVACTAELKARFGRREKDWTILQGSVLDPSFVSSLGTFDIVYSWGVLHHTGQMWKAVERLAGAVGEGGVYLLSLYNDQGFRSRVWRRVKSLYCSGVLGRILVTALGTTMFALKGLAWDVIAGRNPIRRYTEYRRHRGMSVWHDWIDWLGGHPFEVAGPGEVFDFLSERGFRLIQLRTTSDLGCNEYVFLRSCAPEPGSGKAQGSSS